MSARAVAALQEGNTELGNQLLLWGMVTSMLFVWGETLPHPLRFHSANTTLQNGLGKSIAFLKNPIRMCRDTQDPWRIATPGDYYNRKINRL